MKKTLRFSLLSIMMLVCGMVNAATYSYTFTAKTFSEAGTLTLNGVDWTLATDAGYFGYDSNSSDKGQQFGSGAKPATTAILTTSGIQGKISSIKVTTSGASNIAGTLDVSVGGAAFGTQYTLTKTSTEVEFTGNASGEIKLAWAQTSSKAIYVKKIEVITDEEQSFAKDAGLEFSETSVSVEIGAAFTAPTLTKATDAAVVYSSSDESVATVDASTGAVTIAAVGTTTITAKAEATATYAAGEASYKITVIEPVVKVSYTLAKTVESGKAYLLVANNEGTLNVAQMITSDYGYIQVATATSTNDVIEHDEANEIIIEAVEGGYTMKQSDGRYLYQTGTYNSFNVSATPSDGQVWSIEANADGTFKITNNSVNKFIQYDTKYNSYGSYADAKGIMPNLYVKGQATGINGVEAENNKVQVIYNLAGQRLAKAQKGLNIINGKKVVVK